jgi:hypothetical protein
MSAQCQASNRSMATAHMTQSANKLTGPRPGGPVQPKKWHAARRRGARVGRAHGAVAARATTWWRAGRWLDGGWWCWAKRGPMGLTEDVGRRWGGASSFGRRCHINTVEYSSESSDDEEVDMCVAEWCWGSKSKPFVCSSLKSASKSWQDEMRYTFDVANYDRIFD